ncbi:MAG: hypothetical protein OXT72_01240 [Gammaproteobacteria bacterium]|nr:hypothetical protein [Gammaproteobacteria bacterium]MDE0249102.1 hypothetical protein [Gammaproteobacteria bacterium]
MQDRYVGDIGDYAKYGLLRAVGAGRRLGVAWYLCSYGTSKSPGHGGLTTYLEEPRRWRHLDVELFDALRSLVDEGRRSVGEIRDTGILGNAVFADEPVDVDAIRVRDRKRWREEWFERVMDRLSGCDVVFADPDNGLYRDDRFSPGRAENAKRIPLAEAKRLAEGRTAVVYHHFNRSSSHREQLRDWMDRLPGCTAAYRWRARMPRAFFVVNSDADTDRRLERFASSWEPHGTLFRRDDL